MKVRLFGLFVVLCVILAGAAYAAPLAKTRTLILKVGDGVLVRCPEGNISTELTDPHQASIWCQAGPVPPPSDTNTPTSTATNTNTPAPPADTDTPTPTNTPTWTPGPPTDTPTNTPTATNTPQPGGRTWYVEPGTTVMDIANQLSPGDTVILVAGTHHDSLLVTDVHGTAEQPIMIRGERNGAEFLTLIDGGHIRVRNSTYITISDLETVGSRSRNGIEADPDSPGTKLVQGIVWRDLYIHDMVGSDGGGTICFQVDNEPNTVGVFDVLVERFRCERNGPDNSWRDASAVYLGDWPGNYPAPSAPIENVTLRDFYLEDISAACVEMKPNLDGITIERMTCKRSGNPSQAQNGILIAGNNLVVRDSFIEDVGVGENCSSCTGIRITDYGGWISENVLIENNVVRNGTGDVGIGGSFTYYWHDHNVISRGNLVTGFGGHEYWGYGTAAEACAKVGQECP